MAEPAREPSMEDILASIKRIIAEDGAMPSPAPRVRRGDAGSPPPDAVLELTQPVAPADAPEPPPAPSLRAVPSSAPPVEAAVPPAAPAVEMRPDDAPAEPPAAATPPLVSEQAASASRLSLAALSAMVVTPPPGQENTLDGLVRDMLRPMLKDWLDAHLPVLVEGLVAREIARITGRAL